MQQARYRTLWRTNFLGALDLLAEAGARLPFGVPDPVLYGGSAVEFYTGSLWSTGDLEVVASDARPLTTELFAVGFRWSDRPRHAERGLWHPELQIGIDFVEAREPPSVAEQSNRLVVGLDHHLSGPTDVTSLKVVGIEDLIAQQAGCWLLDGAASGALAVKLQALMGLGREGVGGPLCAGYLQRRLALETNGEVVVEVLPSEEGRAQSRIPRTTSLTQMRTRISTWRERCGLSCEPLHARNPGRAGDVLSNPIRNQNGDAKRGGWFGRPSAEILLFDTAVSPPPGW
jgi:hypothetical protein